MERFSHKSFVQLIVQVQILDYSKRHLAKALSREVMYLQKFAVYLTLMFKKSIILGKVIIRLILVYL